MSVREWIELTRPTFDTTLRLLALPYRDHADYDERWKP